MDSNCRKLGETPYRECRKQAAIYNDALGSMEMSSFDYEKDVIESYKRKGFDVSLQDVKDVREMCKAKLRSVKFEDKGLSIW